MNSHRIILIGTLGIAQWVLAADWPHLLGPTWSMTTSEPWPPVTSQTWRVVWSVPKGEGFAAPAVVGTTVVLAHRIGEEICIDAYDIETGQRRWRFARPTDYRDRYGYNGGPRAPAVVANDRVIALGPDGGLDVVGLKDGHPIWSRDLCREFNTGRNFFGSGATPLVLGHRVIVNIGTGTGPCVRAFSLSDGTLLWTAGHGWSAGYAAPVPATLYGRRCVVCFTGGESDPPNGGLLVLDEESGQELARFAWRGRRFESVNAAPPTIIGNRIVISECYGAGTVMVQIEPDGRITPVWTNRAVGVHFMQPVVVSGMWVGVTGHGPGDTALVALDLDTGTELWREPLQWNEVACLPSGPRAVPVRMGRGWLVSTPTGVLGSSELGHFFSLRIRREGCAVEGRCRVFLATQTWAPPVWAHRKLFLVRNTDDLETAQGSALFCLEPGNPPEVAAQ